jgi:hypothetical protein
VGFGGGSFVPVTGVRIGADPAAPTGPGARIHAAEERQRAKERHPMCSRLATGRPVARRLAGVVTMTASTSDADGHTVSLDAGALVVDRRSGKVGVVMGHVGPYVQLRPPRGGREWDVPPEDVRAPTPTEELSAKVAVANRRWGR